MRRAGLISWLKPKSCRIPRHFEIKKNFRKTPAGTWVISIMTFRFRVTDKLIVQTNVKFHGGSEFKGHFNKWPILIEEKWKHHHFVKTAKLPLTLQVHNGIFYVYDFALPLREQDHARRRSAGCAEGASRARSLVRSRDRSGRRSYQPNYVVPASLIVASTHSAC